MSQDIVLSLALPVVLFCIMFSMGTGLSAGDFRRVLQAPASVLTGIASQMLLLPAVALVLLPLFSLPVEIFIGFMILAFSPGGTTSNMFCYLAKGNVALSITLTAVVSLITPFSIPLLGAVLLQWTIGSSSEIVLPLVPTFTKLAVVTLIPVVLGMWLRHYRSEFCRRHQKVIHLLPMIMLLLVIIGIVGQNWSSMPLFFGQTGMPAIALATVALASGYALARLARLSKRHARTVSIETGIQNAGTAILITGTILNNPAMTIAPVMYGILMLLPTCGYVVYLRLCRLRAA